MQTNLDESLDECRQMQTSVDESKTFSLILEKVTLGPFFSIRIFFHRHWRFTGQQGKGGNHLLFHPTNSTRSQTLRHLFATLLGDDYHVFLIAMLVFTRLLLDEIYHLIELPFD